MHEPVLLEKALLYLDLKPGSVVLDGTLGGGGHAREIIERITPGGKLIGIDADRSAVERAAGTLEAFKGSFALFNTNFRHLDECLAEASVHGLDAAMFDLGVSSYQISDPDRGFSFNVDGKLDMRMDVRRGKSALEIVNGLREDELADIIFRFGEERYSRRIARRISEERSRKPIETASELAAIVRRALAGRYRRGGIDPATRTFQAIRIAVNDELAAIEEGIAKAIKALKPGGRICVISFHSLEDRIVKNIFREMSRDGTLKALTKKPIAPDDDERARNPRSRSAKLRAAERPNII